MPQYLVLKTSAGGVPADGAVGTAEICITTQVDMPTALAYAAGLWRLGGNVPLWAVLVSSLTAYHTSVGVTLG